MQSSFSRAVRMTPEERRAYVRRMLDLHEDALRALRAADDAGERAWMTIQETTVAVAEMTAAVTEMTASVSEMATEARTIIASNRLAIDAMLSANRAALGLHNEDQ